MVLTTVCAIGPPSLLLAMMVFQINWWSFILGYMLIQHKCLSDINGTNAKYRKLKSNDLERQLSASTNRKVSSYLLRSTGAWKEKCSIFTECTTRQWLEEASLIYCQQVNAKITKQHVEKIIRKHVVWYFNNRSEWFRPIDLYIYIS